MSADPEDTVARPRVSVVIPALNVADTLGLQLSALLEQDYDQPYEVVVADNGSTDETLAVAEAAGVRVVDASGRRGINHARNEGARHAHGAFVLFCDADDLVLPGWIRSMAAGLATHSGVGGSVVRVDHRAFPRSDVRGDMDGLSPEMPLGRDHPFLPSPLGANCGVRRAAWERLGGLDESYDGAGWDEVEFFWRLQLAGEKITFVDAPILYRVRSDRGGLLRKRYRTSREAARIYKDFRHRGMPRRPTIYALRSYAWLLANLPRAFASRTTREQWWQVAARQAGRLAGCIRYRVYAP